MSNNDIQKTTAETFKNLKDRAEININQFSLNNFKPEQEIQKSKNNKSIKIKNNNKQSQKKDSIKNEKKVNIYGNIMNIKIKKNVKFIDKITKNKLAEIINIESFKKYNKMEEVSDSNNHNNCCIII